MVPERMMEPKNKLNQARRVSMTNLRVATTRHCHTEKTVGTQDSYHILAMKPKGVDWAERKA